MFQQSESRPFLPNPDPTLKIPGLDPTINCLLNSLHNNVKTIFKIIVSSKIPNVMYIRQRDSGQQLQIRIRSTFADSDPVNIYRFGSGPHLQIRIRSIIADSDPVNNFKFRFGNKGQARSEQNLENETITKREPFEHKSQGTQKKYSLYNVQFCSYP